MKKISRLLVLALALQACSRSHPASMEQVQTTINSSAQAAAVNAQSGQTLVHDQSVQGSGLRTEKFKHFDQGIEVLGSGISYHEKVGHSETAQVSAHISQISNSDLSTTPDITPPQAIAIAQSLEGGSAVGQPLLKILPSKTNRLIYQVDLDSGKQVWIDAHHATHIATLQGQDHLVVNAQSSTSNAPGKDSCEKLDDDGFPLSFNLSSCSEDSSSESALRATENAQKFLDYFHTAHDRDSFDGKGSPITSVIHAGQHYANATWYRHLQFMAYGDGDGVTTRDFTYALDVAAHELTHGVIQSSAALSSFGETGALNESIADFFGKMIENEGNWTMGTALGIDSNFEGLRDLKDPSRLQGEYLDSANRLQKKPYPSVRADEAPTVYPCTGQNDFCAVHFNATIPGHAWYGIVQSLGKEHAEKLIYVTLTHFLTELADFDAAAQAVEQACGSTLSAPECKQVRDILASSGMISP